MLRLTKQERVLVIFLLSAFLLGLMVKHLREPSTLPNPPATTFPASKN